MQSPLEGLTEANLLSTLVYPSYLFDGKQFYGALLSKRAVINVPSMMIWFISKGFGFIFFLLSQTESVFSGPFQLTFCTKASFEYFFAIVIQYNCDSVIRSLRFSFTFILCVWCVCSVCHFAGIIHLIFNIINSIFHKTSFHRSMLFLGAFKLFLAEMKSLFHCFAPKCKTRWVPLRLRSLRFFWFSSSRLPLTILVPHVYCQASLDPPVYGCQP